MPELALESGNTKTVVGVVEDDASMRAALVDLLDAAGYVCLSYSSGEDFLASTDRISCDVVVTDIQMGEVGGLELIAALRGCSSKGPPVIVITAVTDECLRDNAFAKGCMAFLRKPFDPTLLLEHVARAASGHGRCD